MARAPKRLTRTVFGEFLDYAEQRDDPELDRWMSEIRLRAIAQIGKISRELEKAKNRSALPTSGKSKEKQLAAAGLSTSTANCYEQLAAREAQLAPAVENAMKTSLAAAAHCRRNRACRGKRSVSAGSTATRFMMTSSAAS
jgi:hypothetical protein